MQFSYWQWNLCPLPFPCSTKKCWSKNLCCENPLLHVSQANFLEMWLWVCSKNFLALNFAALHLQHLYTQPLSLVLPSSPSNSDQFYWFPIEIFKLNENWNLFAKEWWQLFSFPVQCNNLNFKINTGFFLKLQTRMCWILTT